MTDAIPIGKSQSIRACGYDEFWLQDQIVDNPNCLQLGELELIYREHQQASGGRLDILLKDPEDDSMYEVEVMLGETDESHIIRTIEYWDNEKRKWPQREHFAVLVAETITRRFFNVIQLLSHAIPIIAIQVNIVEADGKKILHFSKVLDTYEEPEDEGGSGGQEYNEAFWREKSPWTLDAAKALQVAARSAFGNATLGFVKNYIRIEVNGNRYMWLRKRSGGHSLLCCGFTEPHLQEAIALLEEADIAYTKKGLFLRISADKAAIESKADTMAKIAELVKKSWEE
ncbi:MAG: hypothetical protein NTY65_17220 [Planctomycetota bacterium]|nr:hypothetical protein [Planctomycetota bacterium]